MRKLTSDEAAKVSENNSGDISKLLVADDFILGECSIKGCRLIGENALSSKVRLLNSVVRDSIIDSQAFIYGSTVIKSVIGKCTIVENNSVVKDSVLSPIIVPVMQENKKKEPRMFFVTVSASHITGDVVFGGTDMRLTNSRGGSVFAFSHLGSGEFTKNLIIGSQPEHGSLKNIVNIAHFGYYGKMIVLGLAAYTDGGIVPDINSQAFFNAYKSSLEHRFFENPLSSGVSYEVGRANIGSGGSMSDYDPVKDTKSGAIILLASTGVNVVIPPYLTMLYHSIIANGSVDIAKVCPNNIVPVGSLVSARRELSLLLEGYYTDNEPKAMNDRCHAEMEFVLRYLRMLEAFAAVCMTGYGLKEGVEKHAWHRALAILESQAKSVNKRWLKAYFSALESHSIPGLKSRLKKKYQPRLEHKLGLQLALLGRKPYFESEADSAGGAVSRLLNATKSLSAGEMLKKHGKKAWVVASTEQAHQHKVSLAGLSKEADI